jgi:hypothetical protein
VKAIPAAIVAFALAAGAVCRSTGDLVIQVDLPGVSPFAPGSFDQVVVTDFRDEAPLPDFRAGRELREYLAAEIDQAFPGPVTRLGTSEEAVSAGRERVLILAGSIRMATEVRKALDIKNPPLDGPFKPPGRGLVEACRWTMTVELSVLSAVDGATLYHRRFEEQRDYIDLDKPAEFAFSELSARLRARFLPVLLGSSTLETRTLLLR